MAIEYSYNYSVVDYVEDKIIYDVSEEQLMDMLTAVFEKVWSASVSTNFRNMD